MGNLDEATKRMASAMNQISEIITTNGMDAICILHKEEAGISATPLSSMVLSQNHTSNCRKHAEISGNS